MINVKFNCSNFEGTCDSVMYNVSISLMWTENVVKYKFGTNYLKMLHNVVY